MTPTNTSELRRKLIEFDLRGKLSDEEHLKAFQALEEYIQEREEKALKEERKLMIATMNLLLADIEKSLTNKNKEV